LGKVDVWNDPKRGGRKKEKGGKENSINLSVGLQGEKTEGVNFSLYKSQVGGKKDSDMIRICRGRGGGGERRRGNPNRTHWGGTKKRLKG